MINGVSRILNNLRVGVRASFKQMAQSYKTAAPTNRKFDEGYILLGKGDVNGNLRPLGAFSAELYVMAKAGGLAWQIDEMADKLNRADGTPKSAFELAIIPHTSFGPIQKYIKSAITLKSGERVTLPAPVFKYRVLPDFLPSLDKTGLVLYRTRKKTAVDDVSMNLRNPAARTSYFERGLHYASQWFAVFLAVVVGIETALLTGFTLPFAILPFAAGYLAHRCAKDFMLFSLVEGVLRDLQWMFNAKYSRKGKISRSKAIETSVYLLGIAVAMGYGIQGAWVGTMSLPTWAALATVGVPTALVTGMSLLAAGAIAATAGVGTWLGLSYATRYFWTFSFYDNEISLNEINAAIAHLPFADDAQAKTSPRPSAGQGVDIDALLGVGGRALVNDDGEVMRARRRLTLDDKAMSRRRPQQAGDETPVTRSSSRSSKRTARPVVGSVEDATDAAQAELSPRIRFNAKG